MATTTSPQDRWVAPVGPTDPIDKNSFAYASVARRWPTILGQIVDDVYQANGTKDGAALEEGKAIIEKVGKLRHEMGRDYKLSPLEEDGGSNIALYNDELRLLAMTEKDTWFTAPWLFAECYMYRRVRTYLAQTEHWKEHDPFLKQKEDTFRSSSAAIFKLATVQEELVEGGKLKPEDPQLEILFLEMFQMSLWGNATDLSLLVDRTYGDIEKLQAVGKAALEESSKKILRNDLGKLWEHVKNLRGQRIDFVLDNSGFELYTDLVLADFLVSVTPYASEVVFHPKTVPWFVSDVLPPDFDTTINELLTPSFFPSPPPDDALERMVSRWRKHLAVGRFKLSVPLDTKLGAKTQGGADFWTNPLGFADIPRVAPELLEELKKSELVIFKGDLNYRKLTADAKWPSTTPFEEALGPLAGHFPLLSLRTNKADVIVGLPEGTEEKLEQAGEKDWRVSGKFAVVSFAERTK